MRVLPIACLLTAPLVLALACGGGAAAPKPAAGVFATELHSSGEHNWGLLFVVAQSGDDQIAAYLISCGTLPGWALPPFDDSAGTAVEVENGKFATTDNEDVLVTREFTDPVTIEGSVQATSTEAAECGIPQRGQFIARCGQSHGVISFMTGGEEFRVDEPGPCR
jgi:hypothetical protein